MRILPWLRMIGSRQFGLSSPCDSHVYAMQGFEGILLVDAGSGLATDRIIANLSDEFSDLSRGTILVTHKHPDHAAGAASLSRELGWPVAASIYTRAILEQADNFASGLRDAQAMGGYPPELNLAPCEVAYSFDDGAPIELEGFHIDPIRVRGHSDDSIAFFFTHQGRRCLLSADVVFYGGLLGVINSFDSNLHGYRKDLPKLANLKVDALLPGHGLFTLENGQQHIDAALEQLDKGFVPRMIGQGDIVF